MPNRNAVKLYVPGAYYHVYNRGLNKQVIFCDEEDYSVFLNLLKRYLSKLASADSSGRIYESLYGDVELLAFCLMPNHFHILLYQKEEDSMTRLLRRLSTSYTLYFNKKYKRNGPLLQGRFKAVLVAQNEYLYHISRYIHLNPASFRDWAFSSFPYYDGRSESDWVRPQQILDLFSSRDEYVRFVADYKDHKKMLDEIKHMLADH